MTDPGSAASLIAILEVGPTRQIDAAGSLDVVPEPGALGVNYTSTSIENSHLGSHTSGTAGASISGIGSDVSLEFSTIYDDSVATAGEAWSRSVVGSRHGGHCRSARCNPWAEVDYRHPAGSGSASDPLTPPAPIAPSAPQLVRASAGDGKATITWTAPASVDSFPVTQYQVMLAPGGQTCLVASAFTQCTITGLTNGTTCTAHVRALSSAGWGPYSAESDPFTPPRPSPWRTCPRECARAVDRGSRA